jgi:glycosyltransferase involved in cell wall biosynthesis
MPESSSRPALSVVIPAHDEEGNVRPLIEELRAALAPLPTSWEVIVVDDASADDTPGVLRTLMTEYPMLSVLRLEPGPGGGGNGQSLAFRAGVRAARGDLVAMLDGDRQNDPADLPDLLACLDETGADLVQGDRSRNRRDNLVRKVSSIVGRLFRRWLLGDTIRDTGCSLRVMRREVALRIPFEFKGMHRFVPITARQMGYEVVERPVSHRPRVAGTTSYGIWNRALPAFWDCLSVRWMGRRRRASDAVPVERDCTVRDRQPQETSG